MCRLRLFIDRRVPRKRFSDIAGQSKRFRLHRKLHGMVGIHSCAFHTEKFTPQSPHPIHFESTRGCSAPNSRSTIRALGKGEPLSEHARLGGMYENESRRAQRNDRGTALASPQCGRARDSTVPLSFTLGSFHFGVVELIHARLAVRHPTLDCGALQLEFPSVKLS